MSISYKVVYSVFPKTPEEASPTNSLFCLLSGTRVGHRGRSELDRDHNPDSVLSMLQIKLLFALPFRQFKARQKNVDFSPELQETVYQTTINQKIFPY